MDADGMRMATSADERNVLLQVIIDELADNSIEVCLNNIVAAQSSNVALTAAAAAAVADGWERSCTDPCRTSGFFQLTVPRYSELEYRSHFRMSRSTTADLCQLLGPKLTERVVPVEKKVLATLWLLGTPECFRSVGDRFDLSKSTLHKVFTETCSALVDLRHDFIKMPDTLSEMKHVSEGFMHKTGFPGVIGAVDGTHIAIPGPSEYRSSYINRKGFPSMQLQVVADSRLQFLDVFTGFPGSVHDARVWNSCALSRKLSHGPPAAEFHLLGDSAYPLSTTLLTPYRDNGHLTDEQTRFNKIHASTRVDVERAIGLLKGKWRRLKYLDMHHIVNIPQVIMAACVLHNVVLQKEKMTDDEQLDLDGSSDSDDHDGDGAETVPTNASAEAKRHGLALLLS